MEFEIDREASAEAGDFIGARLDEHNQESSGCSDGESIRIVARDEEGEIVAGLTGGCGWDWLHVHTVWVRKDLRGSGVGRHLMEAAEEEARTRGLIGIGLTSFSFQAPDFYLRLGFEEVGSVPDYPRGGALHFFAKRF